MQTKSRQFHKVGLVLSGGGIKAAAFHIGACLALNEKGFKFVGGSRELVKHEYPDTLQKSIRTYVGSSAGSFVAASLAAGYGVESLIDAFNLGTGGRPRFVRENPKSLKPFSYRYIFALSGKSLLNYVPESLLPKTFIAGGLESLLKSGFKLNGLFSTDGVERYLRKYMLLENDFGKLGSDLFVVATQLNHTRKAIFGPFSKTRKTESTYELSSIPISEAVACSTALPPFFSPRAIATEKEKELYFYDGEIRETLSSHIAADQGCDLVISSYSVQPYHYTPSKGSLHRYGIPLILNQALYQVIEQKISSYVDWQKKSSQVYSAVEAYFKRNNLDSEHKDKILEIITERLRFRPEVEFVYIHPRPQDFDMFFVDHFSLNPKTLSKIVQIGFKSALASLRKSGH